MLAFVLFLGVVLFIPSFMVLGSLSNNDGDGDGDGDGEKQQLFSYIMLFCTFLSSHCTTTA